MKILIKGACIVDAVADYPKDSDILIVDGVIEKIGIGLQEPADEIIDGSGLTLLPGLVDIRKPWHPAQQRLPRVVTLPYTVCLIPNR